MPTEEQTSRGTNWACSAGGRLCIGQRLLIPDRTITKLGFWIYKLGAPPGNVTFRIRKVAGNVLVAEKVWGLANDLPGGSTYEEVTFDTPVALNEEVYIAPWYESGDGGNCMYVGFSFANVKAGEMYSHYTTTWGDNAARDGAYIYTYQDPPVPAVGAVPANLMAAGVI